MKKILSLLFFSFSTLFAVTPFTFTTISPTNLSAFSFQFETDNLGNSVAVWNTNINGNSALQTAFKPTGAGAWQNIRTLTGNISISKYQLQVDQAGNALVVWIGTNNTSSGIIQAAYMPAAAAGIFQTPVTLATGVNLLPQMDIAGGNAIVGWAIVNPVTNTNVVQAAFFPAGGTWQIPGLPSNSSNNLSLSSILRGDLTVSLSTPPQVAVDTFGNAAVVWQMENDLKNTLVVQASLKSAGLPFPKAADPNLSNLGSNVTTGPFVTLYDKQLNIMWQSASTLTGNLLINSATAQF